MQNLQTLKTYDDDLFLKLENPQKGGRGKSSWSTYADTFRNYMTLYPMIQLIILTNLKQ